MMKLTHLIRVSLAAAMLLLSGAAQSQQLAITFDDLPVHGDKPAAVTRLEIIEAILATLGNNHMPPTYGFINAVRVEEDPSTYAVLEAWRAAGQPLGNHTWSHPDLDKTPTAAYLEDIAKDEPTLRKLAPTNPDGQDWHWFRYPFLDEGTTPEKRQAVTDYLAQQHYKIAEVTMSFGDYLWNSPYTRCVAKGDTASIQRLHDSYLAAAGQSADAARRAAETVFGHDIHYVLLMHVGVFDAKMLPELLALYRARGFSFTSLPDAIADPAYTVPAGHPRTQGDRPLDRFAAEQYKQMTRSPSASKDLDTMCR